MLPISLFHYIGLKIVDLLAFRNSTSVAPLPLPLLFLRVLWEDMSTLFLCFNMPVSKAALQLLLRVPKRGAHRGHKMIIAGHMNGLLHFIVILMCDIRPMLQNCNFMDIISHNEAKAGSVAVSRLYWHGKKECFHCFLHVTSPGRPSWQLMRTTKWHCSNCL